MKWQFIFIALMLLVAVPGTQAQPGPAFKYTLSEVAVSSFQKLLADASIDVVLVQNDTLRKAFIERDEQIVPEIAVTVSNGIMWIWACKNISYKGKYR